MERIKKYKSLISEMAYSRDKIHSEIRSSNRNRREHLILLFLLPKDSARNHWQAEIYADIKDISDMKWKVNNKYLSKKEYFDNLWSMPYENNDNYSILDSSIRDLIEEGYVIRPDWINRKQELVDVLKKFYDTISEKLEKGEITKMTVYGILDKLF